MGTTRRKMEKKLRKMVKVLKRTRIPKKRTERTLL